MSFCTYVKNTVSVLCNIVKREHPQDDNQSLECNSDLVHMILGLPSDIIGAEL